MSDPNDTPAAEPSSVKQSSAEMQQVYDDFQNKPQPLFAAGDSVPHSDLWTLERPLGRGGFSEVWLARHKVRDEPVAVKFCTHLSRHKLTKHEMQIIVQTMKHAGDHPNIVPLLECDLTGDVPWLMYEYVEGGTLATAIERWKALPSHRERLLLTVRTLHPIAAALAGFHRFEPRIVHRDLKPQNILMAGAVPRITDFGIGCIDGPLPTMLRPAGTLRYCGSDRLREPPPAPNPWDDVFALGVIAYQLLLADLHADPGADTADDLEAIGTPPALVKLIVRSVSQRPERRPQNASEWEEALTAWLPAGAAPAAVPAPSHTGRRVAVGVSGTWSARPVGSDAPWKAVTDTPGAVPIAPDAEYSFRPRTAISDAELAGLRALTGAPWFRALDLSWCEGLTDAGLFHLTALAQLHALDLSGCARLTDVGLSYLTALPDVRQLDLSCCPQITDDGLRHLAALRRLRFLTLLVCEQLTDAGVAEFRRLMPDCTVRG